MRTHADMAAQDADAQEPSPARDVVAEALFNVSGLDAWEWASVSPLVRDQYLARADAAMAAHRPLVLEEETPRIRREALEEVAALVLSERVSDAIPGSASPDSVRLMLSQMIERMAPGGASA
jgi:hypothetical protein